LDRAANAEVPDAELRFEYSTCPIRSEAVEPLVGCSGHAVVDHLRLSGNETEDHLIVTARTDDGTELSQDQARRLFDVPGAVINRTVVDLPPGLIDLADARRAKTLEAISSRHGTWFDEEMDKLDRWADDKRAGLKADLREHDETLKALKRDARTASSLPDKLAIQKKIKSVESTRDTAWRAYDTEARAIEQAKEALIDDVEARLEVDQTTDRVFQIRFTVT